MPRILLTAFEPFGGYESNSSFEVAQALAQSRLADQTIDWLALPVVASVCVERAWDRIEATRPDLVLALGQAGSSPVVRLEDRGVNFDLFHFPDNGGNLRRCLPIIPRGPALHRTQVPIPDVIERVRAQGHQVMWSFSAGSYVCNHLYFQLLHRAWEARLETCMLFVHLPLLPAQLKPQVRAFALPIDEQIACVRQVLLACVERWVSGSGPHRLADVQGQLASLKERRA
jgi:pyroglutamyl-peptidase